MMSTEILIAGVGNIFHGDDAFGCETVRRLYDLNEVEGIQVVDFGISGIDLAYALAEKCDAAILIDALPQESSPGTLHLLEIDLDDLGSSDRESSLLDAHALNPLSVLRAIRFMQPRVKLVYLVGCEPADLGSDMDGRMGLSRIVEEAVPRAVEMVKSLAFKILESGRESQLLAGGKDG